MLDFFSSTIQFLARACDKVDYKINRKIMIIHFEN